MKFYVLKNETNEHTGKFSKGFYYYVTMKHFN